MTPPSVGQTGQQPQQQSVVQATSPVGQTNQTDVDGTAHDGADAKRKRRIAEFKAKLKNSRKRRLRRQ